MENLTMKNQDVFISVEDNILSITLNRPESLNAFTPDIKKGLKEAMDRAENDPEVHVVTISGAGRAFCAGANVKTFRDTPFIDRIEEYNKILMQMRNLEKPIIAAVQGYAAGGGCNLALACDIIFAADDGKFLLPFAKLGMISDAGSIHFLTTLIGTYRTKEMLFNAEPIDAQTAKEWGIVNRIYPLSELHEQTMQYAQKLARGPRKVYGKTKKLVHQAQTSTLEEILELEKLTQLMMLETEDHKEGIQAFKEKRQPNFKGK